MSADQGLQDVRTTIGASRFAGAWLAGLVVTTSLVLTASLTGWLWADDPAVPLAPKPVDESMHHFMEYFYEPAYKRLKVAVAERPKDRAGWNAIKGDALTLAEGANLLLLRAPAEGRESWGKLSVDVREAAGKVYQAARAQDYEQAHQQYATMISRCNMCHKEFAKGEHQLTP